MTGAVDQVARRRPRRDRHLLFVAPAALFVIAFSLYPLVQLFRMSVNHVTSSTVNQSWAFAGFDNFAADGANGELLAAVIRTVVFVVIVTVIGMLGGFAAALALRTSTRAGGFLLGLMVFIWALPPVVTGSVWKFLLGDHGLANVVVEGLGLSKSALPFLYDPTFALVSVAVVNAWAVIPFNALVFRAAILGIDPETLEAAQLDGAGQWQEVRYVLVPHARPTSLVLGVLTIVYAFRSFDFIYVMTYGGPGTATNTLPFLSYLQAFVRYDFGLGSATAVISVLLVIVLAVVYARSVFREERE